MNRSEEVLVPQPSDISDEDIYQAMKEIPGYLDITPGDFKEVFLHAYRHAVERLIHSIKAKDMMTKHVVSVKKQTTLKEVAELMAQHEISGVPVIDQDNKVIGVISEKDFLFHMSSKKITTIMGVLAECLKSKGCIILPIKQGKAEDIMSTPAITVKEDAQLIEITRLFTEKAINRVPVIDQEEERLIGIISRGDIVRASFHFGGKL
jgi:CBS-domain-containing membrane protein